MAQIIGMLLTLILGMVVVVNGAALRTDDLVAAATAAVNATNLRQLSTVLELYYADHGRYPTVADGTELVLLFEQEGYIRNRPLDPAVFSYEVRADGEDYRLTVKK